MVRDCWEARDSSNLTFCRDEKLVVSWWKKLNFDLVLKVVHKKVYRYFVRFDGTWDVVSFHNSCKNISLKWTSEMIPLFSYCCKKPICNVSMIFHIPDIHCLCDGWRRILISTRRILRSYTISFAKINSYRSKSFMQHKVMVHVQ